MERETVLAHEFVEFMPDKLKDGTVYVSVTYATAAHKCCCGCGNEVITPLSPTDWKLTFDGETISLDPSIGNWSFNCQSHYWIKNNKVRWASQWSQEQIDAGRSQDRLLKTKHFEAASREDEVIQNGKTKQGFWERLWLKLKNWWS